jgi:Cu+-exporting ATPase
MAVAVRALAMNQLTRSNTWRTIWREIRLALLNGVTIAILIGLGALWLGENAGMGIKESEGHASAAMAMVEEDTDNPMDDMPMGAAVDPAAAGVRVEWASQPETAEPGQPVTLSYRVVDEASGETITDLPLDHEQPMHLIVVSGDLGTFEHIHPELAEDGSYRIEATFPAAGTYLLYDEFTHDGKTVLDQRELVVGEPSSVGTSLTEDASAKTVDGLTVALDAPETIRAGEVTHLTVDVTRDGQPVSDLEPYLGAAAHVAIVTDDASSFAHTHGEAVVTADAGHDDAAEGDEHGGGHDVPAAFGPQVTVEHTFAEPGTYKLWVQLSQDGEVITVPFVVEVTE